MTHVTITEASRIPVAVTAIRTGTVLFERGD